MKQVLALVAEDSLFLAILAYYLGTKDSQKCIF